VLWEPSYISVGSEDMPKKVTVGGRKLYIEEWGTEYLMNPEMVKEWRWFNGKNELDLVATLDKPLKIIIAGKGILVKGSREYIKVAQEPKSLTVIKNATHCFDEMGAEDELLKETVAWVKQK